MSRDNYNKLSNDELDFVDDKTAALLLNTPNSARLMLWLWCCFLLQPLVGRRGHRSTKSPSAR